MKAAKGQGFTLIEIVVALAIFSFLSVAAFVALGQILDADQRSRATMQQQGDLSRAWSILFQDLIHLRPRALRDQLGGEIYAYAAGTGSDYSVQLVRGGMPLFSTTPGGLQRVAYDLEDGELIRLTWPTLDALADDDPTRTPLLRSVQSVTFEQQAQNNEFYEDWPPLNLGVGATDVPRMIRVTIELDGDISFTRTIPGVSSVDFSRVPSARGLGEGGEDNGRGGERDSGI